MKNKSNTISVRLDDRLFYLISNNSSKLHISNSEYIRSLLSNIHPVEENHNQEIATALCKLHIRLSELGLEDEEVSREVFRLCQMLS